MGGAIYHSFISVHFLLSIYFFTAQTYKCMHLNNPSLWYNSLTKEGSWAYTRIKQGGGPSTKKHAKRSK